MATKKAATHTEPFKVGDRVTVRYWPTWRGRIVELCGPLGPGGALIFRVRFPRKPKAEYVELREDQLIHLPSE